MIRRCNECDRVYEDVDCWTLCPHGPIWAPLDAYCREHDMVFCKEEHRSPTEVLLDMIWARVHSVHWLVYATIAALGYLSLAWQLWRT